MKERTVQLDGSKNEKNAIIFIVSVHHTKLFITHFMVLFSIIIIFKQYLIAERNILKVLEQHQRDHFNRPSCMQSTE